MKPWTPRDGPAAFLIAGTWMIWNFRPDFLSVSMFHGPVTQKAACCLRKAFCAVEPSTFALMRPSLFHLSISGEFLMNTGFATPMFDGSRFPAVFLPKM